MFARGSRDQILEKANDYARMIPSSEAKFKRLPTSSVSQVVATLSRSLEDGGGRGIPNAGDVWVACVQYPTECLLPPLTGAVTVQFHEETVTNGSFEQLAEKVNQFTKEHRATYFEVTWDDRSPNSWSVIITYLVAYN